MTNHKRLTQNDIAKLAGVSQATVSLVLNGAPAAIARIPAETRERVQAVIRQTGYVADPIARRMAKGLNRILGVFTYEPAFPSAQADFFTPFLLGIEEEAQQQAYDLLLLTSAGVGNNRKIFRKATGSGSPMAVWFSVANSTVRNSPGWSRKTILSWRSADGKMPVGRFLMWAATMPREHGSSSRTPGRWVTRSSLISAPMVRRNQSPTAGVVSVRRSAM